MFLCYYNGSEKNPSETMAFHTVTDLFDHYRSLPVAEWPSFVLSCDEDGRNPKSYDLQYKGFILHLVEVV